MRGPRESLDKPCTTDVRAWFSGKWFASPKFYCTGFETLCAIIIIIIILRISAAALLHKELKVL